MKCKAILILLLLSFVSGAEAAAYSQSTTATATGVLNVNVSNAVGTSNDTLIYLNGHANANFSDVWFSQNNAVLPFYHTETNLSVFYVNITTLSYPIYVIYGNPADNNLSNGNTTFAVFADGTSLEKFDTNGVTLSGGNISIAANAAGGNYLTTKTRLARPSVAVYDLSVPAFYSLEGYTNTAGLQNEGNANQIIYYAAADNNFYTEYRDGVGVSGINIGARTTTEHVQSLLWRNTTSDTKFIIDGVTKTSPGANFPASTSLYFSISAHDVNNVANILIDNLLIYNYSDGKFNNWSAEQQFIPIVASDTIQYANDTQLLVSGPLAEYKKIIITENYTGSVRIQFKLYESGDLLPVSGQIYKNDVAYGTFRTTPSPGWWTFTENFSNITTLSGDKYSIYATSASLGAPLAEFRMLFDYDYANSTPALTYPTNGSTLSFNFPPQVSNINFTWAPIGSSGYQIQVAEDAGFSLIEVDTTTTSNYSVQAMDAGTHYWRVRTYNDAGATLGNWSSTFSFLFTEVAPSVSGAAINGVVYFLSNGAPTPLADATVFLYNSTFTAQQTTGSNGYFLFQNLANGTVYFIKASLKDYQTSEIITVNVSGVMTYNIQMKPTEPTFFENDKQYVLFTARYMFCWSNCDVEGATMTVYKSGEATPVQVGAESNPKTTDSSGSASFLLFKTQLYRITLVNASAGVNSEMTLYPKDTEYLWLISQTNEGFQDHDILERDAIRTTVNKSIINSTAAYINVTFNDTQAQTTNMTVFLNQTNTSLSSWTANGNGTNSFLVTNYQGKSYLIHFYGMGHPEYGTIDYTYSVLFEKTDVGISGIPSALWLWFAVGIMFFTAAIFTASTVELGLIIVCAEGWIFLAIGMFGDLPNHGVSLASFGVSLTVMSVFAIMAYARRQQTKEGYV